MEAKRCCWGARKEAIKDEGDLDDRKEQLRALETLWVGIRGGIGGDWSCNLNNSRFDLDIGT